MKTDALTIFYLTILTDNVLDNRQLYTILMFLSISMINTMIVVILTSFCSIILTKKAALE